MDNKYLKIDEEVIDDLLYKNIENDDENLLYKNIENDNEKLLYKNIEIDDENLLLENKTGLSNILMEKINKLKFEYNNKIKLIILTPCYGGTTYVNYTICLMNTIELFRNIGISLQIEFCKNDSLITRARNNLIAKGMNVSDATHFMFIDNDITWNPLEIIKLLISNKEVIGGVYPLKTYKWDKIMNINNNSISNIIKKKKEEDYIYKYFDDEIILKSQMLKYNMNIYNSELKIENNITEIRHLPTGFMLLKREVIEKMNIYYDKTKYTDDIGFLNESENKFAYALFDTGVIDNHYLSEDWMFCERWKNIGGNIYMDVSILLSHTGLEDYTGCFILSL